MSIDNIFSLLTAVGFGGFLGSILTAYFQSRFEQQKQIKEQEHELKQRRYGAILILLLTKLDPKTGLAKTRAIRPDLQTLADVEKEIETEFLHSVLFASDDVIRALAEFIKNPKHASYVKVAIAMRKDLWGKKTSINEEVAELIKDKT
jgi:hypothetical protein